MKFLLKSGDFDSLIHKGKKETLKKTQQESPVDKSLNDRNSLPSAKNSMDSSASIVQQQNSQ